MKYKNKTKSWIFEKIKKWHIFSWTKEKKREEIQTKSEIKEIAIDDTEIKKKKAS